MQHSAITVTLDEDVALAIFEMLSRWSSDNRPLEPVDLAEEYALLQVLGALESQLVAPFKPDYLAVLTKALAALRGRAGVA